MSGITAPLGSVTSMLLTFFSPKVIRMSVNSIEIVSGILESVLLYEGIVFTTEVCANAGVEAEQARMNTARAM
jgi:hypothetical protein